jgi:hypothetical protein
MSHVWKRTKTHTAFGLKKKEREEPLGRPKHIWEDNIKRSKKWGGKMWTELIMLKKGTPGGLL